VVIGENCVIGAGVRIYDATIFSETKIGDYTLIQGSLIGWKSTIGKWVRINGLTVIAEDVQVKDECFLNGIMVLPHKGVTTSFLNPGHIIM